MVGKNHVSVKPVQWLFIVPFFLKIKNQKHHFLAAAVHSSSTSKMCHTHTGQCVTNTAPEHKDLKAMHKSQQVQVNARQYERALSPMPLTFVGAALTNLSCFCSHYFKKIPHKQRVGTWTLEADRLKCQSQLYQALLVGTQMSYFSSLSLDFSTCKSEILT